MQNWEQKIEGEDILQIEKKKKNILAMKIFVAKSILGFYFWQLQEQFGRVVIKLKTNFLKWAFDKKNS